MCTSLFVPLQLVHKSKCNESSFLAWKSASPPLALCNHWEVGTLRGDGGESIIKAGEVSGSCFDRGG